MLRVRPASEPSRRRARRDLTVSQRWFRSASPERSPIRFFGVIRRLCRALRAALCSTACRFAAWCGRLCGRRFVNATGTFGNNLTDYYVRDFDYLGWAPLGTRLTS